MPGPFVAVGSVVELGLVGQAIGMFAITNVDDLVILALFFGQAQRAGRTGAVRIVAGQYLGFIAILAASILGALGAGLLPDAAIPYLGLLPLALGLRAAWSVWRDRGKPEEHTVTAVTSWQVAAVTFTNGGDNIGVYLPVFATAGIGRTTSFVAVFLVGVAVWCAAGRYFATRPVIAQALARWGHILHPIVLIAIGLAILAEAL